jgi:parallel beta-helix repeat protein
MVSEGNSLQLTKVTLEDNQIGVFSTNANTINIRKSIMKNNNVAVTSSTSTGINVVSSSINGNALAEITLVDTIQSITSNNEITGSKNGIFFDAQSTENVVLSNTLSDNRVDLENANGLAPNFNSNAFQDNSCNISNLAGLISVNDKQKYLHYLYFCLFRQRELKSGLF